MTRDTVSEQASARERLRRVIAHEYAPTFDLVRTGGRFSLALAALGLVAVLGAGCQADLPEPVPPATAAEWVAASARYHDPAARWPAFRAEIAVTTTLPGGGTYANDVLLDRARDTFRRRTASGDATLVQTVGPGGVCRASYAAPDATARDSARAGVGVTNPCAVFAWRRDFYDFLVGLPMSALGDGGLLAFSPTAARDTVAYGQQVVQIRLTYPKRPAEPTWWLYVSPADYRLVAARFNRGASGEWLHYPSDVAFDGFVLKARQDWTRLDGAPLASDALAYHALDR